MGHRQGAEAAKRVVRAAAEQGIRYLTLFGFSSENWSRPADEISELMRLLRMFLRSETAELHRNNIRLRVIGDRSRMPADIIELIESAEALTSDNNAINVNIALDYGGRNDLLHAAALWAKACSEKGIEPTFETAEEFLPSFLMTSDIPDPDILIRTSGEMRISNFMLWQLAYTELFFSDVLWPDFSGKDLKECIDIYQKRDRRFGAIKSQRGDS
jgi:undecaprenyl diphosphate synthase